MKKYMKEIIILLIQLLLFYILPLFAGSTDAMGMVVLIALATFVLSVLIGAISNKKAKYLYPVVIAVLFIPSVYIYYNESALIHSAWYFVISIVGIVIGTILNKLISKR